MAYTEEELKKELETKEYEYGFVTKEVRFVSYRICILATLGCKLIASSIGAEPSKSSTSKRKNHFFWTRP